MMAEARREEEGDEEWRDMRDTIRHRNQATDRSERTKPDHLHSSQGPLSSIRAAIKRTRTNSQSDPCRDRRRPEITILSAEPLASNNWFPGTSGVFPPPPPPSQSSWSGSIQTVSQVIKEKTQEVHIVKPTAAPRRFTSTTTSATQTDPVREDVAATTPPCSAAPQSIQKKSTGKKPQKPPRPSLSKPNRGPAITPTDKEVATNTTASSNTESQSDSKSDVAQPNQSDSSHTYTRSVTVYWDIPSQPVSTSVNSSFTPAESTPPSSGSENTQRPTPLPRSKSRKQPITEEVKVQTLVTLSENGDSVQVTPSTELEEVSSSEYLKELLQVFSVDNQCEQICDTVDQSDKSEQSEDADGEMSNIHNHRNIRAKIQAFESQASTDEGNVVDPAKRPEPRPRNVLNKPPVAAKPSLGPKPSFKHGISNHSEEVSSTIIPQSPTPAPRPQPPKKPVNWSLKEEPDAPPAKVAILPPSRPSILVRAKSFEIQEEETPTGPPKPPVKPVKEPLKPNLNLNNHNSTSIAVENEYVDSPSNRTPVKPQCSVDSDCGSFSRQSVTRRPTTIRVPSKAERHESLDGPPPLPSQKPVGLLNSSITHKQSPAPVLPSADSFSIGPEPSLPPRPSGAKVLPPRPPPAKAGPGRPPPPRFDAAAGRSRPKQSSQREASLKAQAHRSKKQGPVLPPRPNPGHRLYNKYILELPHGIAGCDYNGINTGELSFQKNEVLLLLAEVDHKTFECQVGDVRGRVQKSHITVITPLASMPPPQAAQGTSPAGFGRDSCGLRVQATHDFNSEGPGELGLRVGDVVTNVEQVDNDWYRGTCRGYTGFFPINYVKVLSNSPKPIPEKKKPASATVSGPRCVARFDFDGEHSDELSFSEGDVIQLKEYVGQEWARGKVGVFMGIFPLNFVEVIEDLPPPPSQQQTPPTKIALPGMAAAPNTHQEAAKPVQASQSGVEWAVALYDFTGQSESDLSFQQGDCILITRHVDADWYCGRLSGREGLFPKAFVEISTGQSALDSEPSRAAGIGTAKALYDFTSDCDEELSLQAGDIITNLESIDDEWFLGDLKGKRALVPKNYVQVLEMH
ncbi:SH3 domain-containing protein 19 isoform X2 [Myripristis murdjan]|uniref:SH3 domain-containing protein 19 isoform X2 n=1 Tax=Myripristis murdjan TaxID=586833 RepID=UPI001175FD7B|nr:SH3 domain-containing protein 19 isoform X2 [Myripristis murdjan]